MDLTAGTLIGARYRLERLLGQGGMGVVWAVEDIATHQHHAVKLMKDAAGDPDARRRFLREGRAVSAVRHPNVVSILDVLELADGAPALVMELLEGESLRDLLERERQIALAPLADILVPVISAVGTAHALGVVHRDLKPENIFLARGPTGERVVKVLDFGIAKLTALDGEAARSSGITTGAVMGTPAYMAPEQVFAEKDVDHLADVWALGVLLYQCLSGVLPTHGENVGQVLKHVLSRPFEPLEQLVPDLPPDVSRLVARMLARERSHRPADLREVLQLLGRFANTPGVPFGAPGAPSLGDSAPTVLLPIRPGNTAYVETIALAATVREPAPRSRRSRSQAVLAIPVAIVLLGMGVAGWRWARPVVVRSPLDPPDAKIACPILRASGVEAPAGWLGAAAAAVACERARVILGGRPERTLAPAELLDLPLGPTDTFPLDPYGPPGARDLSVTAAQQRAQAYLDGDVTWSAASFVVTLSLHRADGTMLGSSAGDGPGLYQAVRAAMAPLIRFDLIPKASVLDPEIAQWSRTEDVDDALGVLDLTFAIVHNAGGLPAECQHFAQLSSRVRELGPEGRWLCAYTLGQLPPKVELNDSDPSEAGRATRIRINYLVNRTVHPGDLEFLDDLVKRGGAPPRVRSLLATTRSCLLGSTNPQEALGMAIVAVTTEPKNPEGGFCNPWEQLMTLERDTIGADSAVRAMQAWVPWNTTAWQEPGFGAAKNPVTALALLKRAYVLSPFDTQIASTLAASLILSGDRSAARTVAEALRAGGLPIHKVESDLILVRVKTSEARFEEALELARKGFQISAADTGWVRVQRFEFAWRALELGVLLGRARKVADELSQRYLDPDPSPLDSHFALVPFRIPAICAHVSVPAPCFARFRSLRHQLPGAITQDTDNFMLGAERYVKQDFAGAAKAWRPLLGGRMVLASTLPDAMVDAFARTDAIDLAERVDMEVMKRANEFNGATRGHVRAAYRALARGDRGRALQLAEQVVNAWSLADKEPDMLAGMRRLKEELERP